MKKLLAAFFTLLVPILTLSAQEHATDSWVTFSSDPGRFSIELPEKPRDSVETTQSEHGPYTTHIFIAKAAKSVFLIGWVDYDPSFNFSFDSELNANRDNFIKGLKATLLTSNPVSLSGFKALEFTAETPDTNYISRVYMVGRRPYQLVAGTAKGQDDSASVARFFQSFRIVPAPH